MRLNLVIGFAQLAMDIIMLLDKLATNAIVIKIFRQKKVINHIIKIVINIMILKMKMKILMMGKINRILSMERIIGFVVIVLELIFLKESFVTNAINPNPNHYLNKQNNNSLVIKFVEIAIN